MKIEIGESLIYSWLKHVKNCHIVQTNWKISSNWERENSVHDKVMDLFQTLKKDMEFSDVFKTELDQTLKQAETDVIGLDSNNNVYFVDSAFHESGLTYGSKLETKNRVCKKLLRAYLTALEFFPDRNYKIIFASPKVIHGTKKIITDYFEALNSRYGNEKVLFEFYADEAFRDEILLPTLKKTENEADTSELFLRSCKMLDMFNLIKKTENKTITCINSIDKQKKETSCSYLNSYQNEKVGQIAQRSLQYNTNIKQIIINDIKIDIYPQEKESVQDFVKRTFTKLITNNLLREDVLKKLFDKYYCKDNFGIQYALLQTDWTKCIDNAGYERYWKTFKIDNKYFCCSQWWKELENNYIDKLADWLNTAGIYRK